MDPRVVLAKTAKGREEVDTRKHKLDQRLRMLLITINGKAAAGDLVAQFSKTGDVTPLLDQLLREGFIAPVLDPAVRLTQARTGLATAISTALGPDGDDIAMNLENAKTLDALRDYLEARRYILNQLLGKKAEAFWGKAAELLG